MEIKDLSALAAGDKPVPFTLIDPGSGQEVTSGGRPIRLFLNGPDSEIMVAFEAKQQQVRLTQASRTGKINLTSAELDAEATEKAVVAVATIENFPSVDGKPVTADTIGTLLGQLRWRFLRDFILEKLRDRGLFMAGAGAIIAPAPSEKN